jgi:HK97 family phage portal protein
MLDVILGIRKQAPASSVRNFTDSEYGFSLGDMNYWESVGAMRETTSGLRVSHMSALSHPAFWQAASMIADDVAGLSFRVLRENDEGDFVHDPDHPADYLIAEEANENAPINEALSQSMLHALTWGNGYVFIERGLSGQPVNLLPLIPDRTWWRRDIEGRITGQLGGLYYETSLLNGQIEKVMPEDMLHIKGLQLWSEFGLDPVTFHRDLIGLGQSAFSFASQFYRRGGRAGGLLVVPPGQKQQNIEKVEEGFRRAYENPGEHFKAVVLRDGYKFERQTMTPQESQMTETRAADARDFARIFKIPPQKLGLPDSMGFKSLEQAQKQYLQQAILPWIKRLGGQFRLRLLTRGQRYKRSHKIGVDVSSIIQLDEETLNKILALQRQNLIITANEWRQKVGLPISDDPEADRLVNPNTTAPDGAGRPPGSDDGSGELPAASAVSDKALGALVNDAGRRMLSRLCHDAQRHTSTPARFVGWLDRDLEAHRSVIEAVFAPIVAVVSEARGEADRGDATLWALSLIQQVRSAMDKLMRPPFGHESLAANVQAESGRLMREPICLPPPKEKAA